MSDNEQQDSQEKKDPAKPRHDVKDFIVSDNTKVTEYLVDETDDLNDDEQAED